MASTSRRSTRSGDGNTSRRQGNVTVLVPAARPPLEPLSGCLGSLQRDWQRGGGLAALWRSWPKLVGEQLAPHCRPLRLQGGVLTVGAAPGPWLQALQYNRHQLLGSLRAAGFAVRAVRVERHHAPNLPSPGSEEESQIWRHHPSRVDVHGMGLCPRCGSPAPAGEMTLWGFCGFCRREQLNVIG
jgi:predicted nucleic acid-binding Zn ribbon protein